VTPLTCHALKRLHLRSHKFIQDKKAIQEEAYFTLKLGNYYYYKGEAAAISVKNSIESGAIYDKRGMTYHDLGNIVQAEEEFEKAYTCDTLKKYLP